jgi:hypothetical protein
LALTSTLALAFTLTLALALSFALALSIVLCSLFRTLPLSCALWVSFFFPSLHTLLLAGLVCLCG